MSKTLRQTLPVVYSPFLSKDFDKPAVVEARATCDKCQMCDHGNSPPELSANYFRTDVKCCTYYPSIPNFLVGAILDDPRPELAEGKRRMKQKISERIGVTPQWVGPSKKWDVLYRASSRSAFGRATSLRCRYFTEDERCSIWYHREVICSTYYCKYTNGVAGQTFWAAMKAYLAHIEYVLAQWSAKEVSSEVIEPETTTGDHLTLNELEDRPVSDATYAKYWGPWLDKQEEFYIACFEKVRSLSKDQFQKLVERSTRGKECLEAVKTSYAALGRTQTLPERLSLNPKVRALPVANGVVLTPEYNPYDSLHIEKELYDVLKAFRYDSTVKETRKRLEKEEGIEFEDALLSTFTMHNILVAPPKSGVCDATQSTGDVGFALTSTGRWGTKRDRDA